VALADYLVAAVLVEGRPAAEVAAEHGVSRSWLYELLARYREHGDDGLRPRSRRPRSSPTRTAVAVEDEIVRWRKRLTELGLDAGAATIHTHLIRAGGPAPSEATIWRILARRGFIAPQPAKRPRSSYTRFAAELPNERWQTDITHWRLANGRTVEIMNRHRRPLPAAPRFGRRDRVRRHPRAGNVQESHPLLQRTRQPAHRQRLRVHRQSCRRPKRPRGSPRRPRYQAPFTPGPTTRRPAERSNASTKP